MEQRIAIVNLRSKTEKRFLDFIQYAGKVPGNNTFFSTVGTCGIIIPALSLIISLIMGALQPYYNPIKQTISQLVHYPNGWLQTAFFPILGIWIVLFAIKLYFEFTNRKTTKIAVFILVLIGVCFFMITIFPTNFPGSEKTVQSIIHEKIAQLICVLFPIFCSLVIPEFKADFYWNKVATYTIVTASLGFILAGIGLALTIMEIPLIGLLERIIMLNAIVWLEVISYRMILLRYQNGNEIKRINYIQRMFPRPTR